MNNASASSTEPVKDHPPAWLRGKMGVAGVVVIGFLAVSLGDRRIHQALAWTLDARHQHERELWYRVLRNIGSIWVWLILSVLLCSMAWVRSRRNSRATPWDVAALSTGCIWQGCVVFLSAGTSGLAAELLKMLIGRERPTRIIDDQLVYQGYRFRAILRGFVDASNLGLPSSHAATAAGGAFALAWYLTQRTQRTRTSLLIWSLALIAVLGCSLTRILAGAHFASDVYAGMVLGWVIAWLFHRLACGSHAESCSL